MVLLGPPADQPLVVHDAIFQRIMVAMVVNGKRVPGVNVDGAEAFQKFLVAPATQVRVSVFRYPDFAQQAWWPAGRNNGARD